MNVARRIGVSDQSLYSRLTGESRPASQSGYEYREYKGWRGIPKPRRCPFCKQAKGEIRSTRGGFRGVCPKCGATEPKREIREEDLVSGPAGVRAQALRPDGALVEDFLIVNTGSAMHVCNAPSPAATASLEIGRLVAEQANARILRLTPIRPN